MTNKNIGNLRVSIGGDAKDLKRATTRAQQHLRGLASFAKVAGAAAAASFAAATAGMAGMAKSGLSFVDSQAKMARSIDGSIDALRALQLAGSDAGVSSEAVGQSMQLLGARLAEAARDGFGPTHEALEMIGIRAQDLMRMDADERLATIADRADQLGMSAQATADLLRQFGIRNKEMALLVMQGGTAIRNARQEVQSFGLSISSSGAAAVEAANDAFSRVGLVFEGLRNQLAVAVAPSLLMISERFQAMAQEGGPLQLAVAEIAAAFGDLVEKLASPEFVEAATLFGVTILKAVTGLSNVMITLADNAEIAGAAMIALGAAMAFFSGPIGLAIAAVAGGTLLLASAFGDAETGAYDAETASEELAKALNTFTNTGAPAAGKAAIDLANNNRKLAQSAYEAAEAELSKLRAMNDAAEQRLEEAGAAMPFASRAAADAESELEAQLAKRAEELRRAQAAVKEVFKVVDSGTLDLSSVLGGGGDGGSTSDVDSQYPEPTEAFQKSLASLLASLDPALAKTEKYRQGLALLNQALGNGSITQAEYNQYVGMLDESLKEVPASAGRAGTAIKDLKTEQEKAVEATQKTIDDVDGLFSNLVNNIDNGKEALRQFALDVVKLLAIKGISAILGNGDWQNSPLKIGNNALGTPHWKGGLSWVGERGPELMNIPTGAQIIPNHRLGSAVGGGSGDVFAPNISINAQTSDPAAIVNALKPVIHEEQVKFFNRRQRGGM